MKERCAGGEDGEDEECSRGGWRKRRVGGGEKCAWSWKILQRCNDRGTPAWFQDSHVDPVQVHHSSPPQW